MAKYVIYDAPYVFASRSAHAGQDVDLYFYAKINTLPVLFAAQEQDGVFLPVFSTREALLKFYEETGFGYDEIRATPADAFLANLPPTAMGRDIEVCLDANIKTRSITGLPIERLEDDDEEEPPPDPVFENLLVETFEIGQGWDRTVASEEAPTFGVPSLIETFEEGQEWSRIATFGTPTFGDPDLTETFDLGQGWSGTDPDIVTVESFEDGQGWSRAVALSGAPAFGVPSLVETFEGGQGWSRVTAFGSPTFGVADLIENFDGGGWSGTAAASDELSDSFEIADGWYTPPPPESNSLSDSFEIADGWYTPPPVAFSPAPLAYWPCDEIVGGYTPDRSASGSRPLAFTGSGYSVVPGLVGNAININSSQDMRAQTDVGVVSGPNATMSLWIKKPDNVKALVFSIAGGRPRMAVVPSGAGVALADFQEFDPIGPAFSLSTWHMITMQIVNGALDYYVDGVYAGFGVASMFNGERVDFGLSGPGGFAFCEAAMWDIALTSEQIADLYAHGLAGDPIIP